MEGLREGIAHLLSGIKSAAQLSRHAMSSFAADIAS
jgi:hypothetical protein